MHAPLSRSSVWHHRPPPAAVRDQVAGVTPGDDVIDLSAIDADAGAVGDQAFLWGGTTPAAHSVWFAVTGSDVIIAADVTGDTAPDVEVLLKGVAGLQEADATP